MMSENENENEYADLLEEIVYSNEAIRLAAICGNFGTITEKVVKEGVTLYLSDKDTEKLLAESIHSWKTRRLFSQQIGNGQYAIAVYDKLIRMSIPVNQYQILLVTMEVILEVPKLIVDIKKILERSPCIDVD